MRTLALLLGATLACGVSTAHAQLSPPAQQALIAMLNGAPPYERGLIINALRALGPRRAEMELRQISAIPPAVQQAMGQLVTQILQRLPQPYHQTFINGVFDVSPQETQFVQQVAAIVNSQVIRDRDATTLINRYRDDMLGIQQDALETREDLLAQQAAGTGGALGATSHFTNGHGQWGEGYTGPVGTQTYVCPGNIQVNQNGLPYGGC